ncbi:MAG: DNA pilot protein [Microvirus sp.]|nr:MAG: DNA pilot protein [Microvirus sp.]
MWPVLGGLLTGGASLLGSIFSSKQSGENTQQQLQASKEMQSTQNAWTEQMSNTAYQRASQDMQSAGLNPMMMFGSGSAASSPQASQAQAPTPMTRSSMSDLGENVGRAVSTAISAKTFEKMTQEIANLRADEAVRKSQDITERLRPEQIVAEIGEREARTRHLKANLPVAELEGVSAKAVQKLPAWLVDSVSQLDWGAQKGGSALKMVGEMLSGAVGVGKAARNSATSFRRGMDAEWEHARRFKGE